MESTQLVCDFCGREFPKVRRIVLDINYDKTNAPGKFACFQCSEKKERERKGIR